MDAQTSTFERPVAIWLHGEHYNEIPNSTCLAFAVLPPVALEYRLSEQRDERWYAGCLVSPQDM